LEKNELIEGLWEPEGVGLVIGVKDALLLTDESVMELEGEELPLELPLAQELALAEGEGELEDEGEMVCNPTDALTWVLGLLDLLDVTLTLRLREPLPLPQALGEPLDRKDPLPLLLTVIEAVGERVLEENELTEGLKEPDEVEHIVGEKVALLLTDGLPLLPPPPPGSTVPSG